TGARTLLTDFNTPAVTGLFIQGAADLGNPTGVAVQPDGRILIADPGEPGAPFTFGSGALFRVDPASGAVVVLYSNVFGNQIDPTAVLSDANGPLVLDANGPGTRGGLVRFVNCSAFGCPDPVTVSDFGNAALGPLGVDPTAMARGGDDGVLVVDPEAGTGGAGALFVLTPAALNPSVSNPGGKRGLLSDFGDPATGPVGVDPVGVAADLRRVPAADGDVLVVDPNEGTILPGQTDGAGLLSVVSPVTGKRTVLSDFSSLAEGPVGAQPHDVALESDGQILVADRDAGTDLRGALFRVDPATGRRVVLSDFGDPQQGELGNNPRGVAVERDGGILVADPSPGLLFRIDPADGSRTVLAVLPGALRVAVEGDGHILVAASGITIFGGLLHRVDPTSGAATVLSDLGDDAMSTTPGDRRFIGFAEGVTVEQDGNILLAMAFGEGTLGDVHPVQRVDPDSGIRSAAVPFNGRRARDVAVESSNAILLLSPNFNGQPTLFRVDPATGIGLVLSSPLGPNPFGIAVVGAPQLPPPPPPPDTTPPVITPTVLGTLGTNGWYTSDVNVSWSVTDLESTITTQTGCGATSVTADTAGITFTCEARSAGGPSSQSVTIQRDTSAPSVSCGAADGLWHAGDASIACTASDSTSGLANAADANFNLTTNVASGTETADASTDSRSISDAAGNSNTAGPISGNKIDKKAPSISLVAPASTSYLLGQSVAASYTCSDGGSGLASCVGTVANGSNINTASVGAKTFTVNAADNVANASNASVSYNVIYNFSGFFSPVLNAPTLNNVKAGTSVALRFGLAGNQGLNILAANFPASRPINCTTLAALGAYQATAPSGTSGLQYDATVNQYVDRWKTDKGWTNSCRQFNLKLNDGSEHLANFKFK
ncbi:MAG: PxKF domain-containing protein, partial [Egibacteraceae bacterium]